MRIKRNDPIFENETNCEKQNTNLRVGRSGTTRGLFFALIN